MTILKFKEHFIFLFLIGVSIGFIINVLFADNSTEARHHQTVYHPRYPQTGQIIENSSMNVDNSTKTVEDVKKIRILCYLNTMPASHSKKAVHIRNTWHKHCDKLIFASTLTDNNLGALGFNVTNDHGHLWGKVKLMYQYVHDNFINDYDWFFKGDDDTFLIPENMKYMLASYSPDDPIYFGHKFNTTEHKWGYFSGGSGYVLSRQAVRVFVEQLLTNKSLCPVDTDARTEDWDISLCFDKVNVYAGDSRDLIKRDRFLPFTPEGHLFGYPDSKFWYWTRKYYYNDEGLDCCSNYSIAFHYIGPKYMYTMYFLTYVLKLYGIQHRFPPPQSRRNMSEVINMLELERYNSSYRGY